MTSISNIRTELICNVLAVNKYLKEEIYKMDYISLLRNCDPLIRSEIARKLMLNKDITKDQAKEFTKVIGSDLID